MTAFGWRYAFASVIGSSHVRSGQPCQDASRCERIDSRSGESVLVAVVSDGAGSASHGGEGATVACSAMQEAISESLRGLDRVSDVDRSTAISWVHRVRDEVGAEAVRAGLPVREFACTLLAAIVGPEAAYFIQVGDGVMIVQGDDGPGSYSFVFWPERGEYANTTTFVTADDLDEHISVDLVLRSIDEFAVMSDGLQGLALRYADRSVHEPLLRQLFPVVRAAPVGHSSDLSRGLISWLSSSSIIERTDDDKTIVLATRVTEGGGISVEAPDDAAG